MSYEVPEHFVQQYNSNVSFLVQQKATKLSPYVRMETFTGKKASFDRIGPTEVYERVGRHADTRFVSTEHDRRWVTAKTYDWADLVDDVDKLKMLYDPTSPYAQNAGYAFARKKDKIIIDAALADCYSGEEGDTLVDWSTYTDQIITESGSDGLTLAKLLSAREVRMEADVDPEEKWYMVVAPKQMTNLLNTTEIKSADYNTVKALVQGELNTFMGFEFIESNLLNTNASSERQCFAFCSSGILMGVQQNAKTEINNRPDKNNATQIHVTMTMGAVRMEEEKVIEIECAE